VTTLSDQAMQGTIRLIRETGRRAPTTRSSDPPSTAIVTQFREKDHSGRMLQAAADLRDALHSTVAWPVSPDEEDELVDDDLVARPLLSEFVDALLALPARWDSIVDLIEQTGLMQTVEALADSLTSGAVKEPEEVVGDQELDMAARRSMLAETAHELVYAETARVQEFLATQSLRNLLGAHRTEPPIVVAVGAKGSGKTFTYLQMCLRRSWLPFARDAGVDGVTLDLPIVPVLASQNMDDDVLSELRSAVAGRFGAGPPSPLEVRDRISGRLGESGVAPGEWRRIWLSTLSRALGLTVEPADVERRLADVAAGQGFIMVIDGLEDLFQGVARSESQQQALRVLLTDCLDWMRTLRGRPIGLIVFVRRDLVQAAIAHNVDQFLARYEAYELHWNAEEALRLVLWVCHQAGVLPDLDLAALVGYTRRQLTARLHQLWGEKMGGPRSREARSDQWFLAALSDFKQQIQARDIVSFLAEAARLSPSEPRLADRLLQPAAMRRALVACSRDKIRAIGEENPRLAEIFRKLQSQPVERRAIPFRAEAMDLAADELELLDANGVVFREDDQYWIPEIFRHGLGFTARGRPRILAVANVVRRRNNLD
jgi:hypothetical protein